MGTAIVSLTRQPIMIQQTKTRSSNNEINLEELWKEDTGFRSIFPSKTVDDIARDMEKARKSKHYDFDEAMRDINEEIGI